MIDISAQQYILQQYELYYFTLTSPEQYVLIG